MAGMKGTLTITVHLAANLKDTATIGKQDPFCKMTLGSTTFKTPVHKDGGRNPVWGQSFLYNLAGNEDKLHILICEEGAMMDSDIGRCDIDLKTLCSHLGKKRYTVFDRSNFTQTAGEIELTAEFKGTGGPAILSKSAEVFAMEQKMGQQTQTTNTGMNSQQLEIERLRLQTEALKLQMAQQNQNQQVQYSQPQFNMMAQPQILTPTVVVQQPVKVEMKSSGAQYQDSWGWCGKCTSLFYTGAGGGRCNGTGGAHDMSSTYNYSVPHGPHKPANNAQDNWKWCCKCHCLCFAGMGAGSCAAGSGHDFNGSGAYWGVSESHTHGAAQTVQAEWRWCNQCQVLFFGPQVNSSKCTNGRLHNLSGSGSYHLPHNNIVMKASAPVVQQVQQTSMSSAQFQDKWGWCKKCMNMFFTAAGGGKCAAGGAHDNSASYNYSVPHSSNPGHKAQENWRWCKNCHAICFGGMGQGSCVPSGGHDFSASYSYWVGQEGHKGQSQDKWNWCKNCMCLHFGPMNNQSRCTATGGNHDGSASYSYFVAYQ
jgi:hypothetical protein